MSYNGIGLKTARGSGTSGHVQTNLANRDAPVKKRKVAVEIDRSGFDDEIKDHDRRRSIAVQCMELRDKLEDEEVNEEEIERKVSELKAVLEGHLRSKVKERIDELRRNLLDEKAVPAGNQEVLKPEKLRRNEPPKIDSKVNLSSITKEVNHITKDNKDNKKDLLPRKGKNDEEVDTPTVILHADTPQETCKKVFKKVSSNLQKEILQTTESPSHKYVARYPKR